VNTRHLLALVGLIGCGGGADHQSTVTDIAELDLAQATDSRPPRRMNIDQVKASMEAVTGGIGWTEQIDGEEVDLFERLAGSLGKPDYLASTVEDLDPGLLFQKFLDDAAKSVCTRLIEAEATRSDADRVFLVHAELDDTLATAPDAVRDNLAAAVLRFHGRHVDPGAPQLEPWLDLFDQATSITGDPADGWRLVCVGLFTHPDFYSY
jgi:hypothetical protein